MQGRPMPTPGVGGVGLYPVGDGLLAGHEVIRPEYGGAGLLDDGAGFAGLRRSFAGGLLDGFQYDPRAGRGEAMLRAVAPSGVYGEVPSGGAGVTQTPSRPALTFRDALTLLGGSLAGADPMELSGVRQQQAMILQTMLGAHSPLPLDRAYDPGDEGWKEVVRRLNGAAAARPDGGDGGGDGGSE